METIELTTEKMAHEGLAIARQNRFVIFVDGALPGERLRAVITNRKRRHAYARVVEILDPSPHRVAAPCPVFGECGGCTFQHMDYPAQIEMKRGVLIESLYGIPRVPDVVEPILGVETPFFFRNKMVYAFGTRDGQTILGLHRRGDWKTIIPTETCYLQSTESREVLRRALELVRRRGTAVYRDSPPSGVLRHLVIREGKQTGQRLVHLHLAAEDAIADEFPEALGDLCDTFLVSCHLNVPEAAPPDKTRVIKGSGTITDKLNGFVFEIAPSTFFQTNTLQAERMFQILMSWVGELHLQTAVDLYAGTGPIAMHLSRVAERVVGIESNSESVAMARRNIELNGLTNVEMVCAQVEKTRVAAFPVPSGLIVVDPPRPGLHKQAVETLLTVAPPALIYVSCNPATLARDLKLLVEGGYNVERIKPVDLFPHAFHIETMVLLRR